MLFLGMTVCHQIKLAFISMDLVRHLPSPVRVGYHPIHKGLSRTKRWRKEEFGPSCLADRAMAKLPEIQTGKRGKKRKGKYSELKKQNRDTRLLL